jgi:hypothetical protein
MTRDEPSPCLSSRDLGIDLSIVLESVGVSEIDTLPTSSHTHTHPQDRAYSTLNMIMSQAETIETHIDRGIE